MLIGRKGRRIEIEVAPFDVAVEEDPNAPRIGVSGEAEERGLVESMRRRVRRDGDKCVAYS